MPKITDEELNGAAAALLGLHSRNGSSKAVVPPPVAPPPRPIPVFLPDVDPSRARYRQREPAEQNGRTRPILNEEPPSRPYPFYPSPVLSLSSAAGPSYPDQHLPLEHVEYYKTGGVVSRRRDFLGTVLGTERWLKPQPVAAAPPRHRGEWTPRFGPPMVADPVTVMARRSPAEGPWAYPQGSGVPLPPTSQPSHTPFPSPGGVTSRQHFPGYHENIPPHHHVAVVRDQFNHDNTSTATVPAPPTRESNGNHHYRHHEYGYSYPRQHDYQQEHHQPQQLYHQQLQREYFQQQQEQERQSQQKVEKPSIQKLWSLIPGTVGRDGSRPGSVNNSNGTVKNRAPIHSEQKISRGAGYGSDRWFTPDVHPPLSDMARRHRARALARLRARRRAMAEAAAAAAAAAGRSRPLPVKRHSSETTNEADSGSDDEDDDNQKGHRSKVFLADGAGGVSRVVSGGLARGVSSGVTRAVSGGSGYNEGAVDASEREGSPFAASGSGGWGGNVAETSSKTTAANPGTTLGNGRSTTATTATTDPSSCPPPTPNTNNQDASAGNKTNSSKVGDLFQLMHNVTMSFGDRAAEPVDGEENLARELGKPVKYRYRQEAARSRKRTRGRFVSEKAPAFVSITELMALRRAERERQQKAETMPVPVGAG